jgi:hypothetical protein
MPDLPYGELNDVLGLTVAPLRILHTTDLEKLTLRPLPGGTARAVLQGHPRQATVHPSETGHQFGSSVGQGELDDHNERSNQR